MRYSMYLAQLSVLFAFGRNVLGRSPLKGEEDRCPNPPHVECAFGMTSDTNGNQIMAPTSENAASLFWYDVGERVSYQLKPSMAAYTGLLGNVSVTCLPIGTWNQPPSCYSFCSTPPRVVNATCRSGSRHDGKWSLNERAQCTCNQGFVRLSGDRQPFCRKGNTWGRPLSCGPGAAQQTEQSCQRAPVIPHGRCLPEVSVAGSFRENEAVNCTCNNGYHIEGTFESSTRVWCSGDGNRNYKWGNVPTCVRELLGAATPTCPTPKAVLNAGCMENCHNHTNKVVTFYLGDTFVFQCNEGYTLRGNSRISCQENGTWSASPFCEPDDEPVTGCPLLTGAGFYCEAAEGVDPDLPIPHNYSINCICDDPDIFETVNGDGIICLSNDEWSHSPACEMQMTTETPGTTENPGTTETAGTTETPGCFLADIQIAANGRCHGIRHRTQQVFDPSEQVTCTCDEHYYIEGQQSAIARSSVTCLGESWSSNRPKCIHVRYKKCVGKPIFENGWCISRPYNEKYLFGEGDTISCRCDSGYEFVDPSHSSLECRGAEEESERRRADRVWSGAPKCIASATTTPGFPCPSPATFGYECDDGSLQPGYVPGSVLRCRCSGERTRRFRCRDTGWYPGLRQCL